MEEDSDEEAIDMEDFIESGMLDSEDQVVCIKNYSLYFGFYIC